LARIGEALGNNTAYYFGANLPIYLGQDLVLDARWEAFISSSDEVS
jgi:hypothetical protein